MSELDRLSDRLLADPLAAARAHAATGGRVLGYIGSDVPVELLLAAGALPLQLPARIGAPTPKADVYLEPSFHAGVRSVLEQWLDGAWNFIDSVVFSRGNDAVQRIYYYLCELQRQGLASGPRALLYDLAKIERATSLAHTQAATEQLAQALGSDITQLPHAIAQRNRRRVLWAQLHTLRARASVPAGSRVTRWQRASELAALEVFDAALSSELSQTGTHAGALRVLLAGSELADERLHRAVERAGGCVVDELGELSLTRLGEPVTLSPAPLHCLGQHYYALAHGPRSFGARDRELVERARSARAQAVILWFIEEDEAYAWDVPLMCRALDAAHLPYQLLVRERWEPGERSLATVEQFVSSRRRPP